MIPSVPKALIRATSVGLTNLASFSRTDRSARGRAGGAGAAPAKVPELEPGGQSRGAEDPGAVQPKKSLAVEAQLEEPRMWLAVEIQRERTPEENGRESTP